MFADRLLEETHAEFVHVIDRNGVGITHMSRVGLFSTLTSYLVSSRAMWLQLMLWLP